MNDYVVFFGLLLIFVVLFFGNYASFAWVAIKWSKKPKTAVKRGKKILLQPSLSTKERILSCLPVWQAVEVRKAMYGSVGAWGPIAIIAIVFMAVNCIISWFFPFNGYVLLVVHILFYIGFIMSWVTYAVITAKCALLYDFGKLTVILNIICPNVFCFYIKNNIPTIMREMYKEKTFEDKQGSSTTVIKQKGAVRNSAGIK